MNSTVLIAQLIATIIPLLVLYIIYRLDLYSTGDFKLTIYSFIWGGIAFYLAVIVNTKSVELGIDEIRLQRFQSRDRALLIGPDQARVADHVGGHDGGEPAFH